MRRSTMFRRQPYNKRKTINSPQWSSNNKILVGTNRKTHLRNPNFDPDETKLLISLWGDPKVQRDLITTHKKHPVIAGIAEKMRSRGYNRSTEEINTRIKNLKCFYNRIKKEKDNGMVSTWKHYDDMDEILSRPIFGNSNMVRKIPTPPIAVTTPSNTNKIMPEIVQLPPQTRLREQKGKAAEEDTLNLLKFPEIKIKIENTSDYGDYDDNSHSIRPEDLLKVENRANNSSFNNSNNKPNEDDEMEGGIEEALLSIFKREPITIDDEAQDVDIDNDFDEDDVDDDDDDDDDDNDDTDGDEDYDFDDMDMKLSPNITNYKNNINLSISSVQSKADQKAISKNNEPANRPFELKLVDSGPSGAKTVVVAPPPAPPTTNTSVSSLVPGKKISLVPTNILLKSTQNSPMNFKAGQQILYTKPNTATSSTMPMQIVLVNTVPKNACSNNASAVTNVTQALMTSNPIASVSSTSNSYKNRNDNSAREDAERGISKGLPDIYAALNQIATLQKEALAIARQQLNMDRQREEYKRTSSEKLLDVMRDIAQNLKRRNDRSKQHKTNNKPTGEIAVKTNEAN